VNNPAQKTVIFVGLLIDGSGGEPLKDAAIVIDKERITWTGPRELLELDPTTARFIDARYNTAIPGLVDSHCHIILMGDKTYLGAHPVFQVARAIQNLKTVRQMGVTTIRDLGTAVGNIDLYLREAIRSGLIDGPRMFSSGDPIRMTAGMPKTPPKGIGVDGPYEARKAARNQLGEGADVLKIFATEGVGSSRAGRLAAIPPHLRKPAPKAPGVGGRAQLTEEEIRAVVEEAHKVQVAATCHAIATEGIKNALRAGVDSIEHGAGLDDEAIEMMSARGVSLVPTLSVLHTIAFRGEEYEYPPEHIESAKRWYERALAGVEKARQAGLTIAAGTDPLNDDTLAMECRRLVEAGLTPMEAIVSATRTGAELLGQAEAFGTLACGKLADIVILADNPLENLTALERVEYVFQEGRLVKEPAVRGEHNA